MPNQVATVLEVRGPASITYSSGETVALLPGMTINEGDQVSALEPASEIILSSEEGTIEISGQTSRLFESKQDGAPSQSAEEQILAAKEDLYDKSDFDPNALEPSAAGNEIIAQELDDSLLSPLVAGLSDLESISTSNDDGPQTQKIVSQVTSSPDQQALSSPIEFEESNLLAFESASQGESQLIAQAISLTEDATVIRFSETFDASNGVISFDSQYGTVQVDQNGHWQYQLNNQLDSVQALGAGEQLTEVVQFSSGGSNEYKLLITIHGSNDAASITGDRQANLSEDGSQSVASGDLQVSDTDLGEARFHSTGTFDTTYGNASVDATGNWHYQLDNESTAIQSLREGDLLFDTFSASSLDGSSEIIRIAITGSDDAPLFSGSNQSTLYLGDDNSTGGQLIVSDADYGESYFIESGSLSGKYGTGSIDAQGNWSYQVDGNHADILALTDSGQLYDQLSVSTADGTMQNLIVTINGGNQPAPAVAIDSESDELSRLTSIETPDASLSDGADLYIWQSPEQENGHDSIAGFEGGIQGDKLIISDLLIDSGSSLGDTTSLDQYLNFEITPEGTTLHINPAGANSTNTHDLVLEGFDASQFGNSNTEIIQSLLQSGNLEISGLA